MDQPLPDHLLNRPVLFLTGHLPAVRLPGFAALHRLEGIELALFGGRYKHGAGLADESGLEADPPFPLVRISQRQAYALAGGGRHRAVVLSTAGRIALPAGWLGARRSGLPVVVWSSLWAHPRTPFHLASRLLLDLLYRDAAAVVTYGPHVSRYVRARGARMVFEAPQAVDNRFWSAPAETVEDPLWPAEVPFKALFVGRFEAEKGLGVLLEAWRRLASPPALATLVLVGEGPYLAGRALPPGVVVAGPRGRAELRALYAAADALVLPSLPTRSFREPWGLVVNEAMNQSLAVVTSDAVGAAAGGLVRNGKTGLVVKAGDPDGLAAALARLRDDRELRRRLGEAGRRAVAAYTHEAWAAGFSRALAAVGRSRAGGQGGW